MSEIRLSSFQILTHTVGLENLDARLPTPNSLRRASEGSKLAVIVASDALRDASVSVTERLGLYVAQQQGSLDFCAEFINMSYRDGPRLASPLFFSESVANNTATHLSLTLGLTGVVQTFIGSRVAGIEAVMAAREDLQAGVIDEGLVVVQSYPAGPTSDAYNAVFFPKERGQRLPEIRFLMGSAAFLVRGTKDGARLAFAGVRCFGPAPKDRENAVRGLWNEFGRVDLPVAASVFCLDRADAFRTIETALGNSSRISPTALDGIGECFALDPILRAMDLPVRRAVLCLGEEGTAGLLALDG